MKLVLVDAYSLLFRAFFAGRYLSTTDNRPTGALFGFANMLFTILNTEKPNAIVVCWDAPEKRHRNTEYEAYKAHRPEVDPQLRAQMPIARDLVAAFGVQSAEAPGYEADDLIGTLSERGPRLGYDVIILTGDSDELQLVDEHVTVQMTQRGVSEVKVYDPAAVRARYGIEPDRIPDWKALVGDTSDNIPGVPGVGDKTATTLLQTWTTLENLIEHLDEVTPPKARDAIAANVEQAKVSKRLATIVRDVPGTVEIEPYTPTDDDWTRLRELFLDLEFKSLIGRIPLPAARVAPLPPEAAFETAVVRVRSAEELIDAIASTKRSGRASVVADSDVAPVMRATLRGIAFSPSPEIAYYVPVRASSALGGLFGDTAEQPESDGYTADVTDLRPLVEDAEITLVGQNVKSTEILLERAGLRPRPFEFDTLIAAYLLNSGRTSYPLVDLAETYLGVRLETSDAFAKDELSARNAALVLALADTLQMRLDEVGETALMRDVEMPLVPILAAMEEVGLLVDRGYLDRLSSIMERDADALAAQVYVLAGEEFNIGSTKQLQTILFDKLKLPTGKKNKFGFSTGADILEELAAEHEIARKILDYREVAKLRSTYADALPKLIHPVTGRIHTSLNQTVASTGRLSSSEPNLQNIPIRKEAGREIRRAFIAPRNRVLLSCDYSQIELRILAHVTKDPALVRAFQNDEDVHAATASTVFNVPLDQVTPDMRRQAKTINFAVIYGQGGFALAGALGVDTKKANAWIKEYFARLPNVKAYVDETTRLAHRQKYVSTLLGRRRYLAEIDSGNHNMRLGAERAAVNMPIQGTAADIMKLAMISVHKSLTEQPDPGCTLLLQVHDELLLEVDEKRIEEVTMKIVERMESAFPLDVRLKADAKAGPNWADMRPLR